MTESAKDRAIAALFDGIDIEAAERVLKDNGIALEYSDANVVRIDKATNKLIEQAVKLKRDEAPRSERQVLKRQIDELVNARAFLYRLRPASAGDVTVDTAPVGSN